MEFSSKILENAVNEVALLPGIGKRTALRLVLHLLKQPPERTSYLSQSLLSLRNDIKHCISCFNLSDTERCELCSSPHRNRKIICVVEDVRDVMALEATTVFKGVYHVLGGKISPMDGIAPSDLKIDALVQKIKDNEIEEVIFALGSTMEGDTTNYYIYKQIKDFNIKISSISRGISVGNELEYTDEVTLGRSLLQRIPFELSIK